MNTPTKMPQSLLIVTKNIIKFIWYVMQRQPKDSDKILSNKVDLLAIRFFHHSNFIRENFCHYPWAAFPSHIN